MECEKNYYFVISDASKSTYYYYSYVHFSIIDADIESFKISPSLSNFFLFQKRDNRNQDFLFYSYKETKYGLK